MGSSIEKGLRFAADKKQRLELNEITNQRKKQKKNNEINEVDSNNILFMIGNGLGIFQIISSIYFYTF